MATHHHQTVMLTKAANAAANFNDRTTKSAAMKDTLEWKRRLEAKGSIKAPLHPKLFETEQIGELDLSIMWQ